MTPITIAATLMIGVVIAAAALFACGWMLAKKQDRKE